jgi:regulation of enolase protein 1 (concanavalin A-like superfamily)
MNTIANLIRKDLYHNRRAMLLWLMLVLTHLAIRLVQLGEPLTLDSASWLHHFNTSRRPDLAALLILPVLLIPLIMHADPVQKPLAFWRSLPVSRSHLVAAKALLVGGLFVGLPLLVEIGYFLLAGMGPVLGGALGLWALLHVPVIATIFGLCLVTPGWKSYLCLVVPILGCGLPLPRMINQLQLVGTSEVVPSERPEVPLAELPAGASWQVVPDIGGLTASLTRYAPEAMNQPTEVVGGGFFVAIQNLPPDLVGATAACDGAELLLDNGGRVGIDSRHLTVEFSNGQITNESARNSHYFHRDLPIGECFNNADPLGPIPTKNSHRLKVKFGQVPFAFAALPPSGGVLKGVLRLTLARKHELREWPLEDGLQWHDRLRTMAVRLVEPLPPQENDMGQFSFELNFRRPLTLLSPAATELDQRRFPNHFLWLEHRTHPLRMVLLPLTAARVLANGSISDVSRNLAFDQSRQHYGCYWLRQSGWLEEHGIGKLPRLKLLDEEISWANWRLCLTAYEPVSRVELPFEVRMAKPYRLHDERVTNRHPRNMPLEPPAFAAALAAIELPEPLTPQAAAEAFFRLSALAAPSTENYWQGSIPDRLIVDHDLEIDRLLRRIYKASPWALIEGGKRTAAVFMRETMGIDEQLYGRAGNQLDLVAEVFNGELWGRRVRKMPGYWRKVNKVVETQATAADRDLILANLHPLLDQVPTLERHGWIDDALPVMVAIARRQWVSESWFRVLRQHPSASTWEALLAQVRLRSQSFGRMMELFTPELPETERRQLAEAIWQTAMRSAGDVGDLRGACVIALQHGVAEAPRDLRRVIEISSRESVARELEPEALQKHLLALIQALALWSECPEELEPGCGWILDHGDELEWDSTQRRYVLPGAPAGPQATGMAVDLAGWGTLLNPLGVARLWRNEHGVSIRSSAVPTDYYEGVNHNFSPRILQEVTGDFTAEVTVAPRFSPAPSWSRNPDDMFQSGGLMVEASPRDWLRIDNLTHGAKQTRAVGEALIKGLNPTFEAKAPPAFDPSQPVALQIRRHGDFFVSAWRQGNAPWQEFTGHRIHQWPKTVKVGVLTINKNIRPFEAVFSGFTLIHTATPPGRLDAPDYAAPPDQLTRDGDDLGDFGKAGNISGAGIFRRGGRSLSIVTQPRTSDFNPTHFDNAPRGVHEVAGDFSFAVTIEPPTPGKGWFCPNLMFADAAKRIYFRAGPIHDGNTLCFNAFFKLDTQYADLPPMAGDFDYLRPMRVRLTRTGGVFRVGVKPEGQEWTEFSPFLVPDCPEVLQVGVLSLNATEQVATATFHDPELVRGPLPAERPARTR